MQTLKENWQNLPEKTQKIIKVIAAGTLVITLIAVLALNLTKNKDYSTLFTGLSQEEAQQVVSLLQDSGIDYRYNSSNGAIRVPEASADQTRANLLSQGYPKNGFAYDMYLDHTGLMTTESDKKQITLYDLQDRLGATIRLFEGVRDAKVTIVEATDKQYVLGDSSGNTASASVVVTMNTGSTLTAEKAQAVKNLISCSVRGMNFTTVSVFDSATMLEVGGDSGSTAGGASDLTSLTTLVESNIAANVRRVLEQLYGTGNVAVSVKGKLNMERLIQESTQYTTPDKINETDKTGLLQTEDLTNEDSLAADQSAGGLVGADANADTPRYTNEDGTEQVNEGYSNSTASRVWLYNMLKEQRQIDPGVLEDTSIGVVIISDDNSVDIEDLLRLVANSAGVPVDTVNEKVTIIRSPGPEEEVVPPPVVPVSGVVAFVTSIPLPVLIAIGAGAVLLLLLLLLLMIRSRRRKRAAELLAGDEFIDGDQMPGEGLVMNEDGELVADEDGEGVVSAPGLQEIDDEFSKNEEILNLRMQRSLRLKQNIGDFVDQNPQIAAKLVQSWLRGEEGSEDGRNSHAAGRKQPKQ
ncbi:flagellar M-ring protein FliF [bacterium 1XD42-94]|nr:flagellar M-ring protein FliF [bacterium 1XD42-76]NBK04000.1 flagellar M-ring protein FliF [bacterium 1XD42-94]